MKTKEQELCELLDIVFESAEEPDWSYVWEVAYRSRANFLYLISEVFKLLRLCADDQAAFDEEIWRLTNEAQ